MKLFFRKSRRLFLAMQYAFVFMPSFCCAQNFPINNNVANNTVIINQSNFIFLGTIVKMNASNIDVKPEGPSAIVRIDKVIDAISPYDKMNGKEITVLLSATGNNNENAQRVFYTMGWYYGKTLGVKEVPNVLSEVMSDSLASNVKSVRLNKRTEFLRAQMSNSELVVHGMVTETNMNADSANSRPTEHDPEFRKAIVQVQEVLKGKISAKTIEVYYASSNDVLWHDSPKLSKGQQGIFILHAGKTPFFKITGYRLTDPKDFQPEENLPVIKTLLK